MKATHALVTAFNVTFPLTDTQLLHH